ncbi:hypothetical protein GCM10011579_034790 [Streptomyces albiflavescens]|uniref:Transposase n=1 Tax=Streptomyces albiflavescens TaxID=1623582 RepID=A0A917Y3N8_9ACTN|nr:hypothetical protein GCM10011579_034790 [Streptomyces albiflavescens]
MQQTPAPGRLTLEQVAADFGVHAMTLSKWMRRAGIDDGVKPGTTTQENTELREARRRIKLLEQENEAAAGRGLPVAGESAGKRIYPLVKEPAFAWLHQFKRLRIRYERRADLHQGLLELACGLICLRRLRTSS